MIALLLFILALSIFAALAIYFSLKEQQAKRTLEIREKELNHQLYEISILKELAERIGYSLDVPRIIDIITGSLRNLFTYSTASSLLIKEETLEFKTYAEESVSPAFVKSVKTKMVAALKALCEDTLPLGISESLSGVVLDDSNNNPLASFFNIPLVINDSVVGLINVSSQKAGLYKEEEMTILYRIANQASQAVSKLEAILETEKGKLMSMISSLADGVLMVDVNTKLAVINPKALSMLVITKSQPSIFDVIESLSGKLDIKTRIEEAIKSNKLVVIPEVRLSEQLVLQVLITPVEDKEGKVLGAAVLLHDITAEKTLAQMKEDFTNIMVHELRAPLTTIKQAASLLLEVQAQEPQNEKFLKMIKESAENLLAEVSELLDAAKLEAGRFSVNPAPGNIGQVIKERIEAFTPQAQTKNIKIEMEIDPLLPEISFDKARVSQVLNNLLSNALKFTNKGGVIQIRAREQDEKVAVSVSDTGIGIPREKQNLLFSKFSQLGLLTGPGLVKEGTGLGLYITRGIVEAHGGKIELTSEVGRGTTVTFSLPEKPKLLN